MNLVYKYLNFESPYSIENLRDKLIFLEQGQAFATYNEFELEYEMESEADVKSRLIGEAKRLFQTNYESSLFEWLKLLESNKSNKLILTIEDSMELRAVELFKNKKAYEKHTIDRLRNHVRIFSTSKRNNIEKMWKIFSKKHTGFCIGFNEDYLKNSLGLSSSIVNYYKETKPKIQIMQSEGTYLNIMFSLPKQFNFQEEIRFLRVFLPGIREQIVENYKVKYDPWCVKEIILGKNISESNMGIIGKVIFKDYAHAKLLSSKELLFE